MIHQQLNFRTLDEKMCTILSIRTLEKLHYYYYLEDNEL